jgi:hypothetical protein
MARVQMLGTKLFLNSTRSMSMSHSTRFKFRRRRVKRDYKMLKEDRKQSGVS